MKLVALLLLLTLRAGAQTDTTYTQPFRPQYHFSTRTNWINDPNGLVYYDGEYHLFFQHNPFGNQWGHMTWGHAVSRDLLHWQELPIAIPEEGPVMIFSGSCVVDTKNTSGFGKNGIAPMVAIYTGHRTDNQSQYLAYSLDKGRTWTKYAGNPVIDRQKKDFRDPNVFWHEPAKRWIMSAVLSPEQRVVFYQSPDLKTWTETGNFTVKNAKLGIWECPALMPVSVDNAKQTKWLLLISTNKGAPAGGSGMQYFVGDFDGKHFIPQDTQTRFVDYGPDYYAAIQYNNLPAGRAPITIGWMNNWDYAGDLPTTPFKGVMTLPRELRLTRAGGHYTLRQQPIPALNTITTPAFSWKGTSMRQLNDRLQTTPPAGDACEVTFMTKFDSGTGFGLIVREGHNEMTRIGFDPTRNEVYIDRSQSGRVDFNKKFAGAASGRSAAPIRAINGQIKLTVYVDRSSVEVFANDGAVTLTSQIFPQTTSKKIAFFGDGIQAVTVRNIKSIWDQ